MRKNIYLVGPMGAGKSTIGKRLAKNLIMDFEDSDHVIEDRTGVTIPTIFDIEGEEGFRKRECKAIADLSAQTNLVMATGGGAILEPENREALHDTGTVIYLRTSVKQQLARTIHDKNRPLLQTEDPEAKLQSLLDIREPLYLEVADIIVDTDNRHTNQVVKEIQRKLESVTHS